MKPYSHMSRLLTYLILAIGGFTQVYAAGTKVVSVVDYPSLQEAIDANPGRMVFVPSGDHEISQKLRLHHDHGGLWGSGRIIQTNPDQPVVEVENAAGVELRDVTLTRPEGKQDTRNEGLLVMKCRDVVIENVKVINNRTRAAAISFRETVGSRISHCLVRNYMTLSVDDRTASKDWGYAFNCIDGTGINIQDSQGTLIEGNRVIEETYLPTEEIKNKHKLGTFLKKNAEKGLIMNQKMWDANYTDAWQQGSAVVINSPETTDCTRLIGNHLENSAQGIDIHADHVIVSQNIINNAFMGMKAMHGSRNISIIGNQFIKTDLWAIGLMPGAASHDKNTDGSSIIANNIISDFGEGHAHWIWGDNRSPFKFDDGQKPENPPLTDVIIQGNVLQTIGAPHYKYAVIIAQGPTGPRGLHFSNNILPPGSRAVCNVELPQ